MQNSRLNFIRRKCKTYRPYQFKFFKSGLPQILFGPFLNVLSQKLIKHFFEHGCSEIYLGSCQKSLTEHSSKNSFSLQAAGVDPAFLIRSGPNSEFSCLI